MASLLLTLVAPLLLLDSAYAQRQWNVGQAVRTTSGELTGAPSSKFPGVSTYMGVPFAKPPVGPLRFAAPQTFNSTGALQAKSQKPTCQGTMSMMSFGVISEDCLYLNIFTKPQSGEEKKAVMFFNYGGGFATGGTYGMDGSSLAESQDVIVVIPGYRVGIFGFPDAPVDDINLGLLDVRKAVEWTRDNIAQFGGDPNRIMMHGQSAGSMMADIYSMAYPKDPIIHGIIGESGSANTPFLDNTSLASAGGQKNWYQVAKAVGCNETGPASVSCMRAKSTAEITKAASSLQSKKGPTVAFGPSSDGKLYWSVKEVNKRAKQGLFAKIPHVFGVNANDLVVGFATSFIFDCPSSQQAAQRTAHGVKAWRYKFYAGGTGSGAVHGAELPFVFGMIKSPLVDSIMSTWAGFAKDPQNALDKLGWETYKPGGKIVRLGYQSEIKAALESASGKGGADSSCTGLA